MDALGMHKISKCGRAKLSTLHGKEIQFSNHKHFKISQYSSNGNFVSILLIRNKIFNLYFQSKLKNSNLIFCQIRLPSKQMHHHVIAFPLGPKINQGLRFFHPVLNKHVREATYWYEAETLITAVVFSDIPPSI